MNRKVQLEWEYSPKNFLETEHTLDFNNNNIHFSKGEIVLSTDENAFEKDPFFVADVEKIIKNFLNGFSIQSHSSYKLSRKSTKYFNEDGTLSKTAVSLKTITATATIGSNVEFRITDKDGNVIRDSKQERIEKEQRFASLLSTADDENQRLIDSYLNAINDKENELVHLYEIRDFVSNKLGGNYAAIEKLAISKDDWDLLGEIANSRPILEGRHRGKHEGEELRNATSKELESSRNIAKEIINKYLKHCNSNP